MERKIPLKTDDVLDQAAALGYPVPYVNSPMPTTARSPIVILRSVCRETLPGLAALLILCGCSAIGPGETAAPSMHGQRRGLPYTEPFRIELKFAPGMELTYDFFSVLKQEMSVSGGEDLVHEMKLVGTIHQAVADVEDGGKTGLIGLIGKAGWTLTSGKTGTNAVIKDEAWCAAHRVDRSGNSIRRIAASGDKRQYLLRRAVDQYSETTQICAQFPAGDVKVGSSWTGNVLLPTPGTRQAGQAVSRITDARKIDGTLVCEITSEVTSSGGQSHETWKIESGGPEMEISGTTVGHLDVDRGIWMDTHVDLRVRFMGRTGEKGFDGLMNLTGDSKLISLAASTGESKLGWRERVRAFDAALVRLFGNGFEEGVKMLEEQQKKTKDTDWKKGLETALKLVRPILKYDVAGNRVRGGAGNTGDEPDSASLAFYRQAAEQAGAGKFEEAAESYRKFLAVKDETIPAGTRVLARFRLAGLMEKLGKQEKALAEYRGIAGMEGMDDYSMKLKEKAAEKVKILSGGEMKKGPAK